MRQDLKIFLRLTSLLGFNNMLDALGAMREFISAHVDGAEADAEGDYMAKGLAEVDKRKEDNESTVFNGREGRQYVTEHLLDLFIAGIFVHNHTIEMGPT